MLAGFLAGGIYQGVSGDSSLYVVSRYTGNAVFIAFLTPARLSRRAKGGVKYFPTVAAVSTDP
jgi:hypothetical protein